MLDNLVNEFIKRLNNFPMLKKAIFGILFLKGLSFVKDLLKGLVYIFRVQLVDYKGYLVQNFNRDGKKWGLVTGGSMGIGKEFVKILGDCGFNILIVSNDEGSNKRVVEDLEKEREKKLK